MWFYANSRRNRYFEGDLVSYIIHYKYYSKPALTNSASFIVKPCTYLNWWKIDRNLFTFSNWMFPFSRMPRMSLIILSLMFFYEPTSTVSDKRFSRGQIWCEHWSINVGHIKSKISKNEKLLSFGCFLSEISQRRRAARVNGYLDT